MALMKRFNTLTTAELAAFLTKEDYLLFFMDLAIIFNRVIFDSV